jgi:hypothetical protein
MIVEVYPSGRSDYENQTDKMPKVPEKELAQIFNFFHSLFSSPSFLVHTSIFIAM